MGVLDELQYRMLRRLFPGGKWDTCAGENYRGLKKLEVLFGPRIWEIIRGKRVLDYGCGEGNESISIAHHGAAHVVGLDIQPNRLAQAKKTAQQLGIHEGIDFVTEVSSRFDVIVSVDAFEHFRDPASVLDRFDELLAPHGSICISFGPPWKHPLGGHLFSVFPWAHLILSEKALLRWRADFNNDGATRFGEVRGGLNQMTIRRFEKLIASSPFRFSWFEAVPIRRKKWMPYLHNRWTREWLTSIIRCQLVRKPEG
jgi:SAM-dependent methyltransferase